MSAELLTKYEPTPTGLALEHGRQLWQARFSPCGRFLVAPGYDAAVQRWDFSGEKPARLDPLTGHDGWVQCLGFAPKGERVFTADSWGRLTCWPYAEPQPLWTLPQAHKGWVRALAVSPDGRIVATGGNDRVVRLWSAADGKFQKELPHPDTVFSLCFHPDGTLVSGDLRAKVRQWDVTGANGTVMREFEAAGLYQLARIQECGGARHLAFDAAGQRLAVAGQKNPEGGFATGTPCALVFDWEAAKVIREMPVGGTQDGFAYDARFHPDGFVMGTSGAFPGTGHVWFWRPEDDKAFHLSKTIPNGRSLSLHPDGRRLALLTSLSPNGNGRQLKDGQYAGGTAKIHILSLGKPPAKT